MDVEAVLREQEEKLLKEVTAQQVALDEAVLREAKRSAPQWEVTMAFAQTVAVTIALWQQQQYAAPRRLQLASYGDHWPPQPVVAANR